MKIYKMGLGLVMILTSFIHPCKAVPEKVQLLSPARGSSDGIAPVLMWQAVEGATRYSVAAAFNPACINFESLPEDCLSCLWIYSHPTNTFSMENYGAGTYYWRVAVLNEKTGGQEGWSEIWSFTIKAPTLISPGNNAKEIDTATTLTWEPFQGAIAYELTRYSIHGSEYQTVLVPNLVETQFSMSNLEPARWYSWKIRVVTNLGKTGWSELWRFQTLSFDSLPGPIDDTTITQPEPEPQPEPDPQQKQQPKSEPEQPSDGSVFTITAVAPEQSGKRQLLIYPVPAVTELTLEVQGFSIDAPVKIIIMDVTGRQMEFYEVTTNRKAVIPVEVYPKGVYFIRAVQGNDALFARFVKQ